jgi:16S rRNA (uracil1498-N3)-methyltransferase
VQSGGELPHEHLHRFFVRRECVTGGRVRVDGADARQIHSVLRLREGDRIAALDGTGCMLVVQIADASKEEVVGDVVQVCPLDTEPKVKLTIAQALPKADKLEFIIQKGTELGVVKFDVITTARTVARPPDDRMDRRLARWRSIAKEAAEQSCRAVVPEVTGITSLGGLLPKISEFDLAICLWEDENKTNIRRILNQNRVVGSILIVVGPEGGLEEEEVRQMEAAGAKVATLGRRVLRCETAAIAATAMVLYELEMQPG